MPFARATKHAVTIDAPDIDTGVAFNTRVFGLEEARRPGPVFAALKSGEVTLGIMEKPEGSQPAPGTEDRRRYTRNGTPVHLDIQIDDVEAALEGLLAAGAAANRSPL